MTARSVLIIDDEKDLRDLIGISLGREGFSCDYAASVAEGINKIAESNYDLCLTDLRLDDGSGMEILRFIQSNKPDIPAAMISAHGDMELAIEALKLGAFDFLNKPIDLKHLSNIANAAVNFEKSETDSDDISQSFVGKSEIAQRVRQTILKYAKSQAPVLIRGESGTGKEVSAKLIHQNSSRKDKPFIAVNCGAIPKDLVESELFGHLKGSFTGAINDKKGLFEAANGGTLLLDEIADLPLDVQVKLLRVIQEKKVRPIGSNKEIDIDVRLLSATHKSLEDYIQQGIFRSDLYYRINVIDLHLPPLRNRQEDLLPLIDKLSERINNGYSLKLSIEAIEKLRQYDFPGNIRELENILQRAIALSESNNINVDAIVLSDTFSEKNTKQTSLKTKNNINESNDTQELSVQRPEDMALDRFMEAIETEQLEKALTAARWNKTKAAKMLGISFRSLRYRLEKLGIEG